MKSRFILLSATLAITATAQAAQPAPTAKLDVARPEVQAFVQQMQREHGFNAQDVVWVLRDAVPQPRIIETMQRPAEASLAWWEYRARFLTDERIDGGVRIWNEHRADLERIAKETGVAPQYLVAITGVETFYGRITGSYRVLDSLPYSVKRLASALHERGVGVVDIKKRGIDVTPERLRPQLKLRGDAHATVILTRLAGRHQALIVEPLARTVR